MATEFFQYFEISIEQSQHEVVLAFDSALKQAREAAEKIIEKQYPNERPWKYDINFVSFRFEQRNFQTFRTMVYTYKLEVPK